MIQFSRHGVLNFHWPAQSYIRHAMVRCRGVCVFGLVLRCCVFSAARGCKSRTQRIAGIRLETTIICEGRVRVISSCCGFGRYFGPFIKSASPPDLGSTTVVAIMEITAWSFSYFQILSREEVARRACLLQ